jgi:hypothetical protein
MHINSRGLAKLERRKRVAERYLRLETQWEIARALCINQSTVSRDLHAIRTEWAAAKDVAIDGIMARELAKIDLLESTYWAAWERSCKEREVDNRRLVKNADSETVRDEGSKRLESRDGDPRYLAGIERCIRLRAEILGIIKNRQEVTGPDASAIPITASVVVVEDAAWFGARPSLPAPAASTPVTSTPSSGPT